MSNVEVVRATWEALERDKEWSDEDLVQRIPFDLYHEDVAIINTPEFPVGDSYHGHDGLQRWAGDVWAVFAELHNHLIEVLEADAETVVTVQRTEGRMRLSELPMKFHWATIWSLRDGKISAARGYASVSAALKDAGIERDA